MSTLYNQAIELFQKHQTLTDLQLQKHLNANPNSVRPVRLKLQQENIIQATQTKKKHTRGRKSLTDERSGYYTVYKFNPIKKRGRKPNTSLNNVLKKLSQFHLALAKYIKSLDKGETKNPKPIKYRRAT